MARDEEKYSSKGMPSYYMGSGPVSGLVSAKEADEKKIASYVKNSDEDIAQLDHGFAESTGDSYEGKKEAYYDLPENKFEGLVEYFDPRNEESVMSLQKEIGANPDGIFGPKSRQALAEYLMSEGKTIPVEQLERFDIGNKSRYVEYMSSLDVVGDKEKVETQPRDPKAEWSPRQELQQLEPKESYSAPPRESLREDSDSLESKIIKDLKGL